MVSHGFWYYILNTIEDSVRLETFNHFEIILSSKFLIIQRVDSVGLACKGPCLDFSRGPQNTVPYYLLKYKIVQQQ